MNLQYCVLVGDSSMASSSFSLKAALKALHEEGFVVLDDTKVGQAVSEIAQRGFPYLSPYGLRYYKQHVLDDMRIRSILEAVLGTCSLGHWLRYKAFPGHIECFRKGGVTAGLGALVVEQWSQESRADYYKGSHLLDLPTEQGIRKLHEISREVLTKAGSEAVCKTFTEGNLVIRDARLCAETKAGYAITYIFAIDEVLAAWPKIILPNLPELVRLAVRTETENIRINFAIKDY